MSTIPVTRSITLPRRGAANQEISTGRNLLFVGANGSGKTRLGTWLDMSSPDQDRVFRISAQKSLSMPDTTTPISIDLAEQDLVFGHPNAGNNKNNRWPNKPATFFLNDFQKLMVFLFSDETEENAKFKVAQRQSAIKLEPPLTKMDKVKQAWELILPHRELVIGGLRIQTQVRDDASRIYNSSEMSDGERVIFVSNRPTHVDGVTITCSVGSSGAAAVHQCDYSSESANVPAHPSDRHTGHAR